MGSPPRGKASLLVPLGDAPPAEFLDDELLQLLEPASPSPNGAKVSTLQLRKKRIQALENLTPLEQEVVNRRFGLDGRPIESDEQIAKACSLSLEEVAQISDRTLRRLRWPTPQ